MGIKESAQQIYGSLRGTWIEMRDSALCRPLPPKEEAWGLTTEVDPETLIGEANGIIRAVAVNRPWLRISRQIGQATPFNPEMQNGVVNQIVKGKDWHFGVSSVPFRTYYRPQSVKLYSISGGTHSAFSSVGLNVGVEEGNVVPLEGSMLGLGDMIFLPSEVDSDEDPRSYLKSILYLFPHFKIYDNNQLDFRDITNRGKLTQLKLEWRAKGVAHDRTYYRIDDLTFTHPGNNSSYLTFLSREKYR